MSVSISLSLNLLTLSIILIIQLNDILHWGAGFYRKHHQPTDNFSVSLPYFLFQ